MVTQVLQGTKGFLSKFYTIQDDLGAKLKTIKKPAVLSQGTKDKKDMWFLELKRSILERIQKIRQLNIECQEQEEFEMGLYETDKSLIHLRSLMREEIRQATEEWNEMNAMYQTEMNKDRSKFTKEELEVKHSLIQCLYVDIEKAKESLSRGHARGKTGHVATNSVGLKVIPTKRYGTFR